MYWSEMNREQQRRRRAKLERLPLTREERARWSTMMRDTWQAIAPDYMEACQCSGQRLSSGLLVEAVCDANRMMMFADMTVEEDRFLSIVYSRPSFQRWARDEMNYC